MARPCKRRRVCGHPSCGRFGPAEQAHGQPEVLMGLDEFETIRLIDLEGLTQEEVAERDRLRRIYLDSVRANLTAQLDNTYLVDEKGNRRKLPKKGESR